MNARQNAKRKAGQSIRMELFSFQMLLKYRQTIPKTHKHND